MWHRLSGATEIDGPILPRTRSVCAHACTNSLPVISDIVYLFPGPRGTTGRPRVVVVVVVFVKSYECALVALCMK